MITGNPSDYCKNGIVAFTPSGLKVVATDSTTGLHAATTGFNIALTHLPETVSAPSGNNDIASGQPFSIGPIFINGNIGAAGFYGNNTLGGMIGTGSDNSNGGGGNCCLIGTGV
jgi:hypothetical protein